MININPNTTIYLMCISNKATGGPELLHQLAFELRRKGVNAIMYYVDFANERFETPVHQDYKIYSIPYTVQVADEQDNVLIIPEIYLSAIDEYKYLRKIVWWLSIDNSFFQFDYLKMLKRETSWYKKFIYRFYVKTIKNSHLFERWYALKCEKELSTWFERINMDSNVYHLAQSNYAMNFLLQNKVSSTRCSFLSDYLRDDYLNSSQDVDIKNKKNIVVYNPKKGIKFTSKIILQASNIKFIPIQNMSYSEVTDLLKRAKVYIDFGAHPGKDRIPREAAIMKCCVITGRKGSANFTHDVAISEEYKFKDIDEVIPDILSKILFIFDNFETCLASFESYRRLIMQEQQKFVSDINSVFKVK